MEATWLKDEASGILNWSLQGLQRLLTKRVFTESESQQETQIEFQRASDTVSAFVAEQCIIDRNLVTARSVAFEAYKDYCDLFGLEAENEKIFTQRLKEIPKVARASNN